MFLRFTRYCVEKILAKNSARGEKMTNIRYAQVVPRDDWDLGFWWHCLDCCLHFGNFSPSAPLNVLIFHNLLRKICFLSSFINQSIFHKLFIIINAKYAFLHILWITVWFWMDPGSDNFSCGQHSCALDGARPQKVWFTWFILF